MRLLQREGRPPVCFVDFVDIPSASFARQTLPVGICGLSLYDVSRVMYLTLNQKRMVD